MFRNGHELNAHYPLFHCSLFTGWNSMFLQLSNFTLKQEHGTKLTTYKTISPKDMFRITGNGNNIAKLLPFEFNKMMFEICSILIQILQFALIFWFLKAQQIGTTDNFNGTERKRNIKKHFIRYKKGLQDTKFITFFFGITILNK